MVLVTYSMAANADRARHEADIRQAINQVNAAYTRQDAEAMAPLLAEDFETWDGIKGRKEVSESWANENVHYRKLKEPGIRVISDDVAIYRERGETWDVADNDQRAPDTRIYIESWILVLLQSALRTSALMANYAYSFFTTLITNRAQE